MGIMVEKDDQRSQLGERITADLRERVQRTSSDEADAIEDSAMLEGTQKGSRAGWFWITLVVLALISLGIIFFIK